MPPDDMAAIVLTREELRWLQMTAWGEVQSSMGDTSRRIWSSISKRVDDALRLLKEPELQRIKGLDDHKDK